MLSILRTVGVDKSNLAKYGTRPVVTESISSPVASDSTALSA